MDHSEERRRFLDEIGSNFDAEENLTPSRIESLTSWRPPQQPSKCCSISYNLDSSHLRRWYDDSEVTKAYKQLRAILKDCGYHEGSHSHCRTYTSIYPKSNLIRLRSCLKNHSILKEGVFKEFYFSGPQHACDLKPLVFQTFGLIENLNRDAECTWIDDQHDPCIL